MEQRDRFAASFCGFRARLVAFMMCATVGMAAFGAVAAFLTLIAIKVLLPDFWLQCKRAAGPVYLAQGFGWQ